MNRPPESDDPSKLSLEELFRLEVELQTAALTAGLLECERGTPAAALLDSLMRAAHSLKGAARMVGRHPAVQLTHVMEDCFVAAQQGRVRLEGPIVDTLLRGVDLLRQIAQRRESGPGESASSHVLVAEEFLQAMRPFLAGEGRDSPPESVAAGALRLSEASAAAHGEALVRRESSSRVVRLSADALNRLLGLAGESLVETRWLRPFSESMQRLRRLHSDLATTLDGVRGALPGEDLPEATRVRLNEAAEQARAVGGFLSDRLEELEQYDRRTAQVTHRLYLEVLRTRMRPFGDGVQGLPRMVRDLALSLGKQVRLEILGENTQVDRDMLDQLEIPLTHLLRNAVDHGCEPPAIRVAAGKAPEALILLEARHSAGALVVTVTDDGTGVDLEQLRKNVVRKELALAHQASQLSEVELLEFLFLPGFSMRDQVTEISGRGVGLDVVHDMVKRVRGTVRVATQTGRGMRFQLQLPLTLSVLRALLVEIGGEPYALPLAQITHTLKLPRERVQTLEGRPHFDFAGQRTALLSAAQILDSPSPTAWGRELPVLVLGERQLCFGLVVDRLLGERELVVQPLDPRLGKVQDISAAALTDDGSPVLIVDVDELLLSIGRKIANGELESPELRDRPPRRHQRVLAVDDSRTVRDLVRRLLGTHGYLVDVAVDGADAWNAVRQTSYDLVITDVDMPRLDGIELTTLIKQDARLKSLPVLIVSYKDREADRLRGLEAGADYYLAKGSFHDETLLQAVMELIGAPES